MATRSIVTSQPDVECAVCERRLLRGEQPDLFLDAGHPRLVCELCAPRAAHQGWKRGSAGLSASAAPVRARRGRGLFERLRGARQPAGSPRAAQGDEHEAYPLARQDPSDPYDFLTPERIADGAPSAPDGALAPAGSPGEGDPRAPVEGGPLQDALDVFNCGEYPRRVASLTRSLGAPEVTVRPGEAVASSVVIVLAWELCWYTYEVDLDDMQGPQSRAIAQGSELSELGPDDRLANAVADERGTLALL
jgi:hypothetical protein